MDRPSSEISPPASIRKALARNWWLVVLRGLLAVLFGLAAFIWPGLSWLILVTIFGIYAIVDGIVAIVAGLARNRESRWWAFLLEGLVSIAAGIAALVWPGLATFVIIIIIATWAVITGVFEIVAAIRLRKEINNEWLLAIGGVISVALGLLLFASPAAGSLALIWVIGAYALIFGILLISLGIRLKREGSVRGGDRGLRTA